MTTLQHMMDLGYITEYGSIKKITKPVMTDYYYALLNERIDDMLKSNRMSKKEKGDLKDIKFYLSLHPHTYEFNIYIDKVNNHYANNQVRLNMCDDDWNKIKNYIL